MLSNEEALELIKKTERCFVVWARDKNAIVSVHPLPAQDTVEQRLAPLSSMRTDYEGPTVGRFFDSAKVTLETLEAQHSEISENARRAEIFNSWQRCSTDELISILENWDFTEPMDSYHGSSHIVRQIYRFRSSDLKDSQLGRLEQFARSLSATKLDQSSKDKLECYLSALRHDPARLKRFWQSHLSKEIDWAVWDAFTTAVGDLRVTDGDIINQLIYVVQTPFMFGPRLEAVMALGKIGAAAGLRAADVIRTAIHDSSEIVAEVRKRAIARILSTDREWRACGVCEKGYVSTISYRIPSATECQHCYGLAFVPVNQGLLHQRVGKST